MHYDFADSPYDLKGIVHVLFAIIYLKNIAYSSSQQLITLLDQYENTIACTDR